MRSMTRTLATGLLAVIFLAGLAGPAAGQSADKVAVVDLRAVLESLDERSSIESASRRQQQQVEGERSRRVQEIQQLRSELPVLAEGSDARRAKEDQIVLRQAELEAYIKVQRNKIQRDVSEQIDLMREKMEASVETVAKERGIQVVFTRSIQVTVPGPDGQPRSVPAPQVVWAAPGADITNDVIDRMNAEYNQRSDAGGEAAEPTGEALASSEAER